MAETVLMVKQSSGCWSVVINEGAMMATTLGPDEALGAAAAALFEGGFPPWMRTAAQQVKACEKLAEARRGLPAEPETKAAPTEPVVDGPREAALSMAKSWGVRGVQLAESLLRHGDADAAAFAIEQTQYKFGTDFGVDAGRYARAVFCRVVKSGMTWKPPLRKDSVSPARSRVGEWMPGDWLSPDRRSTLICIRDDGEGGLTLLVVETPERVGTLSKMLMSRVHEKYCDADAWDAARRKWDADGRPTP